MWTWGSVTSVTPSMLFADINVRDQRKCADVQTYPRACCNNTGVRTLTNVSDTDPILPQCPCAEVPFAAATSGDASRPFIVWTVRTVRCRSCAAKLGHVLAQRAGCAGRAGPVLVRSV